MCTVGAGLENSLMGLWVMLVEQGFADEIKQNSSFPYRTNAVLWVVARGVLSRWMCPLIVRKEASLFVECGSM